MSEGHWGGSRAGKRSWRDDSSSSGGRNTNYEERHRGKRHTNYQTREQPPQCLSNDSRAQGKRLRVPRADDLLRQEQRCTLSKVREHDGAEWAILCMLVLSPG